VRDAVVRALGGLVVIAAIVALVVVFTSGDGGDDTPQFPDPVVRVVPEPGQLAVRQARIGIVVKAGYEAELYLDGRPIPKDQLIVNEALGEYFYQPMEGLEIEELAEGRRCVSADIVNRVHPEEDPPDANWCFTVA
jgi:hypothetical protein